MRYFGREGRERLEGVVAGGTHLLERLRRIYHATPRRRKVVTGSLFLLLILFCGAIGFGLGGNSVSAWTVLFFTVAAILALQVGYIITLVAGR
jgi:hypothetical protein